MASYSSIEYSYSKAISHSALPLAQRSSTDIVLDQFAQQFFYGLRMGTHVFQPLAAQWIHCNRSFQVALPLFWKGHPHLNPCLSKFVTTTKMVSYFAQLIKTKGSCRGQCLAILDQISQDPSLEALEILARLKAQPSPIYYFQCLEILRGQGVTPSFGNIQGKIDVQFPQPDKEVFFTVTDAPQELMSQRILYSLRKETNIVTLLHYWVKGRPSAHTLIYRYSNTNRHYWFYNSRKLGLYSYRNGDSLLKSFVDHVDAFFLYDKEIMRCCFLEFFRINSVRIK